MGKEFLHLARTCPACRLGQLAARGFGVDVAECNTERGGTVFPNFSRKPKRRRRWFGAAGKIEEKSRIFREF